MRRHVIVAAAVAAISLFVITVYGGQTQTPEREQYEYAEVCWSKDLNKMGAEGWRLVTSASRGGTISCFYMERRK